MGKLEFEGKSIFVRLDQKSRSGRVCFAGIELTPREIEILSLRGQGRNNKEAARVLGISYHTLKNTLVVASKRNGMTIAGMAAKAFNAGILSPIGAEGLRELITQGKKV